MQIIKNTDVSTHTMSLAHAVATFHKITFGGLAVFLDNMTVCLLDALPKFNCNTENICIYL